MGFDYLNLAFPSLSRFGSAASVLIRYVEIPGFYRPPGAILRPLALRRGPGGRRCTSPLSTILESRIGPAFAFLEPVQLVVVDHHLRVVQLLPACGVGLLLDAQSPHASANERSMPVAAAVDDDQTPARIGA